MTSGIISDAAAAPDAKAAIMFYPAAEKFTATSVLPVSSVILGTARII